MNAKEIRSKRMDLGGPFVDPIEAAKIELLQEIAAQMAELNEPVAPVNAESPWIQLYTQGGNPWVIDKSEIVSVRDATQDGDPLCFVSTKNSGCAIVRAGYFQLGNKLGITLNVKDGMGEAG